MKTPTNPHRAGARLLPGLAILGAALPVGPQPASARPVWASGTLVYTDLCTQPENGARVGHRVVLRRSPNGDTLTYEGADGTGPVAAGDLTFDAATRTLAFAVETEGGPLRFAGVAAGDAFTGTFADEAGAHPVHLPRALRPHARTCAGEPATGAGDGAR